MHMYALDTNYALEKCDTTVRFKCWKHSKSCFFFSLAEGTGSIAINEVDMF